MNNSITRLFVVSSAVAVAFVPGVFAGTQKPANAPVVITPPAVPDGSNFSRAPFPAARPQHDVTPPNGEAFDQDVPPNTPATTPAPLPPPAPVVAILQPRTPEATEPGVLPTGLPSAGAAVALDAAQVEPSIRAATYENRDDLVENIRGRVRQSESTLTELRRTENQMNAPARSQFQAAADEARAREKALQKSIRAASRASEAEWDAAKAQLVADYNAYASAVAQVDAIIGRPGQ